MPCAPDYMYTAKRRLAQNVLFWEKKSFAMCGVFRVGRRLNTVASACVRKLGFRSLAVNWL